MIFKLINMLKHSGAIDISRQNYDALLYIRDYHYRQSELYKKDTINTKEFLQERSKVGLAIYSLPLELHQYIYMAAHHLPFFNIGNGLLKITPFSCEQEVLKKIEHQEV